MFSGSDYVLRFAQTLVQILVLLVLAMIIGRYPDLVKDLTGIGVKINIEREAPLKNGGVPSNNSALELESSQRVCR